MVSSIDTPEIASLDWKLVPPDAISEWDGLLVWFIRFMEDQPEHQKDPYLRRWLRAGKAELGKAC
jgi:hypothetical protein